MIRDFECSDAIEVCDGIIFDFHTGLDGDLPEHSIYALHTVITNHYHILCMSEYVSALC